MRIEEEVHGMDEASTQSKRKTSKCRSHAEKTSTRAAAAALSWASGQLQSIDQWHECFTFLGMLIRILSKRLAMLDCSVDIHTMVFH